MLDKHAIAIVSITGNALDALGALYLTYDLLGGKHGPLRTLTRAITYGVFFGAGTGLFLGPVFGLATGVTHGITLAWEFSRAAKGASKPGFWHDVMMSAIRGGGYVLGATYLYGPRFGITFGALSAVGQVIAYRAGMRPTIDYAPASRPSMTKGKLLGAVNRTVGYALAGYISAIVGNQPSKAMTFGLEAGLVIGGVTAILSACVPFVEWAADNVPAKRMGVIGIALILFGFTLQSLQYWIALLD